MRRRSSALIILLLGVTGAFAQTQPGFRFIDITKSAGIRFTHNTGAFGKKYLPETLGPGAAFLDFDNDGWQDILLQNGMDWPGHKRKRTTPALYRNNRNGTFSDVTKASGLDFEIYGMGIAAADFNNDGFVDVFLSAVGQSRLLMNTGKGTFVDVTRKAGLFGKEAFSTSALWFDYDKDGRSDLFVANYVRWSPDQDVFCSIDGKTKTYCTPEAYRGATVWLFRNRGEGGFEDVTARAGLLDMSSKSLGVAMLDYDNDSWPDLVVANDTQPNKLYRNQRDGTFAEIGVRAGLAFSEEGKARAGMGVDAAYFDGTDTPGIAVTNFFNEMMGLYRPVKGGGYSDEAPRTLVGKATRRTLGFGCFFFDANLDGFLDLLVANGHIDDVAARVRDDVKYAQPPHLFLNDTKGVFRDIAAELGVDFAQPKVARGAAYGDIDNDGDPDVLITTNGGPAYLFRNDLTVGNRSVRLQLVGAKSNRSAIGAVVRYPGGARVVKTGSSYLSQSELPLTIGLNGRDSLANVTIDWPSGVRTQTGTIRSGERVTLFEDKGVVR